MKKPILMLALMLSMGVFFTSCRDTAKENETDDMEMSDDTNSVENDIEQAADDAGDAVENAANETGDAVENAANEVEDEVENNDDY